MTNFFDTDFDLHSMPSFPNLPARRSNIWLASYPKSGNTWMRLFLSAYLKGKDSAEINEDLSDNNQCNNEVFAEIIARKRIEQFTDLDVTKVRVGIQRLYARNPQNLWIKTHAAIGNNKGFPTFDASSTKASIVILRNPLAVLPSFALHMGLDLDIAVQKMADQDAVLGDRTKRQLPVFISSWSGFTRSWISAQTPMQTHFVKYEDLKNEPVKAFSRVLSHLRQPVDDRRLRNAIDATSFDKLKAQDLSKGFSERSGGHQDQPFFRSGKIDGWRNELEDRHIHATIANNWDAMEQLGYIPPDLQVEFEDIKFNALEDLVSRGVDIGVYAKALNDLRAKRGVKGRLAINSGKTQISEKEITRRKKSSVRPQKKRTFR